MINVNRVLWDIETTGLNPRGIRVPRKRKVDIKYYKQKPRITCISYSIDGRFKQIVGSNEDAIITEFLMSVWNLVDWSRIFGFNTHAFDMPYLIGRMEALTDNKKDLKKGYNVLLDKRIWRDILQISRQKNESLWIGKIMSQKEVAEYYGILYDVQYTGTDMLVFAYNGEYDKIGEHGKGDIGLLDMIIQKMCEEKNINWRLL